MKKLLVTTTALALLLSSCSAKNPLVITENFVDEFGNTTRTVTTTIADASIARDKEISSMHNTESDNYFKAIADSGTSMKITDWKPTEYNGATFFMPLIESKSTPVPVRNFNLPKKPSPHPVWGTIGTVAKYTLYGFGINQIMNGIKSLAAGATYAFSGDNPQIYGSFNSTTGTFSLDQSQVTEYLPDVTATE